LVIPPYKLWSNSASSAWAQHYLSHPDDDSNIEQRLFLFSHLNIQGTIANYIIGGAANYIIGGAANYWNSTRIGVQAVFPDTDLKSDIVWIIADPSIF